MSDRPRIVLGEDDFDDPVGAAASTAPPAHEPPPARQPPPAAPAPPSPGALPPVTRRAPRAIAADHVTAAPAAGAPLLRDPRVAVIFAALVGVIAGWAVSELSGITDIVATSMSGSHAVTGLFTGIVGVCLGIALLGFDRAVDGAWAEAGRRAAVAALPLFAIGFGAGYLAGVIYWELLESLLRNNVDLTLDDIRIYLVRALGWAIFGIGIGAAVGLVDRSRERAINGAIGGALGGAAGAVVFQYAATHMEASDSTARLVGLIAIALCVGIALRLVETARREAWLHVIAGGMRGKEFILYHEVTRIGSSPECEVFLLKDPAVAPEHARIGEEPGSGRRIVTAAPGAAVLVNGTPIVRHQLRAGDEIQIGGTVVAYAERGLAPAGYRTSTEEPWT